MQVAVRVLFQDLGNLLHWLHHAQLTVHGSDGHQNGVRAQQFFQVGKVHRAVLPDVQEIDLIALLLQRGQSAADGLALAAWVKTQDNAKKKTYKAVCYGLTTLPDDMHVVNFINEKVTFSDDRGEKDGVAYLPSLVGIFAVCNVKRGSTNYLCPSLSSVQETEDNDAALGEGKFILVNNDDNTVHVAQGINSMTTTDGKTRTEDMCLIETVEAMDMIKDDIAATFRETYLGNYRNSRDNQMMLVNALNSSYFRQLMQQTILDPDYANAAMIDVDAQRAAWVASGKSAAADWDDDTVKANPFKRTVYLTANVKILNSMTDLIFPITMA